jgi:hypothetical protein
MEDKSRIRSSNQKGKRSRLIRSRDVQMVATNLGLGIRAMRADRSVLNRGRNEINSQKMECLEIITQKALARIISVSILDWTGAIRFFHRFTDLTIALSDRLRTRWMWFLFACRLRKAIVDTNFCRSGASLMIVSTRSDAECPTREFRAVSIRPWQGWYGFNRNWTVRCLSPHGARYWRMHRKGIRRPSNRWKVRAGRNRSGYWWSWAAVVDEGERWRKRRPVRSWNPHLETHRKS